MKTTFNQILQNYALRYGVTEEEIKGSSRKAPLPEVRARIIYEYKTENPAITWKALGEWLNLDHSSVMHFHKQMACNYYGPATRIDYKRFTNFTSPGFFVYDV